MWDNKQRQLLCNIKKTPANCPERPATMINAASRQRQTSRLPLNPRTIGEIFQWTIMPHSSYSLDLAPSDYYHWFLNLKGHLSDQRFQSNDEVKLEVKRFLDGLVAAL